MFVALAGLLIPFLIHLWNRRRRRVILFGSTQFLEATQRKKISRLSFSQPLLFLLRALMIALCVLLLAEPVRVSFVQLMPQKNPNWLLISPSLLARNDWQTSIDTMRYQAYQRRVLARGFHLLKDNFHVSGTSEQTKNYVNNINTWSLLADIAKHPQAPDSIAVYFTPHVNDFEGIAPALPTHITWHEIPTVNDNYHIIRAWQESDNKVSLIIGKSNEEQTVFEQFIFVEKDLIQTKDLPDIIINKNERKAHFKDQKNTAVQIEDTPKLNVAIYYDSQFKKDRNYLYAALKSIAEYTDIQIDIKRKRIKRGTSDLGLNEEIDAVFWLSETSLADSIMITPDIRLFTYKKDMPYRENFIEKTFVKGKKIYCITGRLQDAESTIKLPQSLLEILLTPYDFDDKLAQFDQRKIVPSQYQITQISNSPSAKEPTTEKRIAGFHHLLWWLLLGMFLVERSVVQINKQ